ncbi:MAG: glycosyltransferase family 2 protein [Candidatus Sumerlaeota bacterium]|nr:glycosyltransferase family 2 protein [Candidatus Sumerlaeota bacterium]
MNGSLEHDLPFITAAVVNWNGLKHLPGCLDSLRGQQGVRLEILLIDNASSDGSADWARANYPDIILMENRANRGYAGALNQAADRMRGDFLLALNTDIRMQPTFLAELACCIRDHAAERCGYAMGKARFMTEDGRPTPRLYSTGHLFARNRLVYNRGNGQIDRGQYDREERVPGANAAAALFRRDVLEDLRTEVGVFDELFFLYGNDVDFDWLAAYRGWAAYYCPTAVCYHVGEASSHISRKGFDAPFVNARFLMMIKNDRPLDVLLDLPFIMRRNIADLAPKLVRNPWLLWAIPTHLARSLGPALRSRWKTRQLRRNSATDIREWMRWSTRLLRESSRFN